MPQNSQEPRRQQQLRGFKLQERGGSSSRAWGKATEEGVLGAALALAKILKLCCWRRARDSSGNERAKDLPKEKMR